MGHGAGVLLDVLIGKLQTHDNLFHSITLAIKSRQIIAIIMCRTVWSVINNISSFHLHFSYTILWSPLNITNLQWKPTTDYLPELVEWGSFKASFPENLITWSVQQYIGRPCPCANPGPVQKAFELEWLTTKVLCKLLVCL